MPSSSVEIFRAIVLYWTMYDRRNIDFLSFYIRNLSMKYFALVIQYGSDIVIFHLFFVTMITVFS